MKKYLNSSMRVLFPETCCTNDTLTVSRLAMPPFERPPRTQRAGDDAGPRQRCCTQPASGRWNPWRRRRKRCDRSRVRPRSSFALGVIGTGLLAVPVLAGSAAYAIGEARKWPVGLARQPLHAKGFYATITRRSSRVADSPAQQKVDEVAR
jgi:hypothetical protein